MQDLLEKTLTNTNILQYTEGLKTFNTAFTPRQRVFFVPMAWMRAENNQYQPELLLKAFSESAPLLILNGVFLRKFNKMTNAISVYNFNQNQIRTTAVDGNPYFCLVDACGALGLSNSRQTKTQLSRAGVTKTYISYPSGTKELTFINEPNLYRLIFRSNKPQAQAFADWVYSEVLPSIRKTGAYITTTEQPAPSLPQSVRKEIGGIVKSVVRSELKGMFASALESGESYKSVYPTSDDDLIKCLWSWYATHHKKTFDAMREITAENDELKCKLLTIRKAVQ